MNITMLESLQSIVNTKQPQDVLPPLHSLIRLRTEELVTKLPSGLTDQTKADLADLLEVAYTLGMHDGTQPLGSLLDISICKPDPSM